MRDTKKINTISITTCLVQIVIGIQKKMCYFTKKNIKYIVIDVF